MGSKKISNLYNIIYIYITNQSFKTANRDQKANKQDIRNYPIENKRQE